MRREDLSADDCGIAQTLGVVGDWWSWLVVREIAGGTTRFDGVQRSLGISRRALTERLDSLVSDGVLERRPYSERPVRHDYVLTRRGEGLLPVLVAMQEYGDRYLLGDGTLTATAAPDSAEAARAHALLGRELPPIELPAYDGRSVALRPADRWRVLYLFPGAFAPDAQGYPPGWGDLPGAAGCTLESTTYARRHGQFRAAGAEVVGVSTQRPDQQAAFAAHAGLPFDLLSDQDLHLAAALRLPTFRASGVDRFKRQSLLVDPGGVIRHIQMPVTDPAGSVEEMLEVVRSR
ncbi:winged helix-turn-helix transcriptional regulator [Luteipulveratus sp. YIM 133132]|uniref:winged helix-turn-helix transcriptional regulator n=1 Tax=Luteipulveratus flavus TaxID=3031728 RepID=UPI0023AF5DEB|nr:winged helix-turn-helix transcriptional regulator [Luteipulveratus sp. YIM 133132]MDE9367264.1 winged helix-turn-helix transcriptional regulator [Luteipulveratus sp. YIM 133132]